jgi:Cys-tRNA(Pro)/Cys-tRNA(Cys) deacylase
MCPLHPQQTPVSRALDVIGVPFRLFNHPGPVLSLEQAAQERGQRPEQVLRSILFRLGKEGFVMVLTAGEDQISWQRLRRQLGVSRLTLATRQELLAATGYEPGTVAPFGLPQPVRVLVDEKVFEPEEVSLGSGVRGTAVIIKTADLRKALGEVEVGCFVECEQ